MTLSGLAFDDQIWEKLKESFQLNMYPAYTY